MNDYNQYPENDYRCYLEHGTKGKHWTWPDHKYIDIINGRYIYPATQAIKRAVGQVTSGQIVRDTVRTVKGAYNAAKTGGLKGTAEYLKSERNRKKEDGINARNSASSDYAESDQINRRAFKKQEKARKKAEKARNKRINKLTKAYKRSGSLLGRLSKKIRTKLSGLKIKNIKRNFYKWTGGHTIDGAITAYLARREKRSKQLEAVAKQLEREEKKRARQNELKSKYDQTIRNQSGKNKAAKYLPKNISRKTYRDTGMTPGKYVYKKIEDAYNDDRPRDAIKGWASDTKNSIKDWAKNILSEDARNQEKIKKELEKKNKKNYNINVHGAS